MGSPEDPLSSDAIASRMEQCFSHISYILSVCDPCIYHKKKNTGTILIGIYVRAMISTGSNNSDVERFRLKFKKRIKCSFEEVLDWYFGMEVI